MTQLVVQAERRDELPPTRISPAQLPHPQSPTLSELRAALEFYQLARAITKSACEDVHMVYPEDRTNDRVDEIRPMHGEPALVTEKPARMPEEPARMPEWQARVDQAVYRVLTLGAALAGAYQEPMFKAGEHPDPDINTLRKRAADHRHSESWGKKLAFLMQFAVCDLAAPLDAQEAIFGPVGDWLLENILSDRESREAMAERFERGCGRAEYCVSQDPGNCPVTLLADGSDSHSDAHFVLLELMRMLWVVEYTRGSFDHRPPSDARADENTHGPLKSVIAVLPGAFRGDEIMLSFPVPRAWTGEEEDLHDVTSVANYFDVIFKDSGRPNYIEDDSWGAPVPPLHLKFFEYFLQRHLQLCFDHGVFRQGELRECTASLWAFASSIAIFSHDDVEERSPHYNYESLLDADFLDGSELVVKHPPDFEPAYEADLESMYEQQGW